MTQGWMPPAPDPGYRVDGALPPGFDVMGQLARLYPGYRLTRGMAVPLGAATVTITAGYVDLPAASAPVAPALTPPPPPPSAGAAFPPPPSPWPAPAPASPAAFPSTAPGPVGMPGMTDPAQLALYMQSLQASGQVSPEALLQLLQGGEGADPRAAYRSLLASGIASGALAYDASYRDVRGGFADRLVGRIREAALQHAGDFQSALGAQGIGPESIRAHDPAFTEEGLLAAATAAFQALLRARAENRPEAAQHHLGPSVYRLEAAQIQKDARKGRRRVVEELEILSVTIDQCGAGPHGDVAMIRFRLWGADRRVNGRGRRVDGDRRPKEWHEVWTFARPAVVTTPAPGASGGWLVSHITSVVDPKSR